MSSDAPQPPTNASAPRAASGGSQQPAALIASNHKDVAQLAVQLRSSGLVVLACAADELEERLAKARPHTLVADLSQERVVQAIEQAAANDAEALPPLIALGLPKAPPSFPITIHLDASAKPSKLAAAIHQLLENDSEPAEAGLHQEVEAFQSAKKTVVPTSDRKFSDRKFSVGDNDTAMQASSLAVAELDQSMLEATARNDGTWSLLSDLPTLAELPEITSLLRNEKGSANPGAAPTLSPQIQALLDTAARQVVLLAQDKESQAGHQNLSSTPIPRSLRDSTANLLERDAPPPSVAVARSQAPSAPTAHGPLHGQRRHQDTSWPAPYSDPAASEVSQRPSPSTQGPSPSTQGPSPSTQGPSPSTQGPSPSTQGPSPSTQGPATIANPNAPRAHEPSRATMATDVFNGSIMPSEFLPHGGSDRGLDSAIPHAGDPPLGSAVPHSSLPPQATELPRQTEFQSLGHHSLPPSEWALAMGTDSKPPTDIGRGPAPSNVRSEPPTQAANDSTPDVKRLLDATRGKSHSAERRSKTALASTSSRPSPDRQNAGSSQADEMGDPIALLGNAIRDRVSGTLILRPAGEGFQRAVRLNDGDIGVVSSNAPNESLIHFLALRGDLNAELAAARSSRLPHSGRHAAAALIAQGFLSNNELWPVLRQHAEWILQNAISSPTCRFRADQAVTERLAAEPNVFGGATGVEVFIELVQRAIDPADALKRLGGMGVKLVPSNKYVLLRESALTQEDVEVVKGLFNQPLGEVLKYMRINITPLLYALSSLDIVQPQVQHQVQHQAQPAATPAHPLMDTMDADAVRMHIAARLELVRRGSYFELLGIAPHATSYEVRRAFVDLRRQYQPARLLTGSTADLASDIELIAEVIEEAYDVLRDDNRRRRYQLAIHAQPASG